MYTLTDMFCGAGGSSTGAAQVPGVRVAMAANHWDLAVETHQLNHPDAAHDCADISQTDPRRFPRTDLLWGSPSCTHHSGAQGKKRTTAQMDIFDQGPADDFAERSRATMWDPIRFAEHHRYQAIIVENVIEIRDWILWPAWTTALNALGYDHQVIYLNSMFATQAGPGAPQSRDRLYVVAWLRGNRAPDLDRWTRPTAWCPTCDETITAVQAWKRPDRRHGKYGAGAQYVWRCPRVTCRNREVHPAVRAAADILDWTKPGARIGDRPRPLTPRTMRLIKAGLARNATASHMILDYNGPAKPVSAPLPTITTIEGNALCSVAESPGGCDLRMLTVAEHQAAMAFPTDYVILGSTKKNRIRLLGNAVTPPAARDLVSAVVESLS